MSLSDLEDVLRRELELMSFPNRPWVRPRKSKNGDPVYDVLVVGGGQSGLSLAAMLRREQVTNVLVLDKNPAGRAGPWLTFARMKTLRTPNYYTGPCLGLPNLTVQMWWEAQHGLGSWANTGLTPTKVWAAYIEWYRQILGVKVESDTKVSSLRWMETERFFEATVTGPSGARIERARRIIDASGFEGSGQWAVPSFVSESLPKRLYYHTCEDIPFESLRGKRVGVLGAGSAAFDNSVVALEHGSIVEQFYRRETIPKYNPHRWVEFVGLLANFDALRDADKYRYIRQFVRVGLPVTESTQIALGYSNFTLHAGEPWVDVRQVDGMAEVRTKKAVYRFDRLICGTGLVTNLALNPLYSNFVNDIALWSDRYEPPAGQEEADLLRHPYLGPAFELTEKVPGKAPFLAHIYNYTFGAWLNHGLGPGTIAGFKYAIPKLVKGITRSFFLEDSEIYLEDFQQYLETGKSFMAITQAAPPGK